MGVVTAFLRQLSGRGVPGLRAPRRGRRFVLALAALLLTCPVDGAPVAYAEGTAGESTVHTNTAGHGDGTRTPDIIATGEDRAVVAWREGIWPGKVDQGHIRYAYTTDGGATWSRPRNLAQATSEAMWHYVILYRAGSDIYAFLGRTSPESSSGLPVTLVAKRSADEGHTWQDHTIDVPSGIANLVVAGRPLRLADGTHVVPFWSSGQRSGVLRSADGDLSSWTAGSFVPDPNGLRAGEPQIVESHDEPGTLIMTARPTSPPASDYITKPTYAATARSTDGGLSWSPFTLDTELPNYNTKGFLTRGRDGQYLTIYNTAGRAWTGPEPALAREVLHYKVKRPGERWSSGRFFADGPRVTAGTGTGWDTYAMADEYAPGRYFVVWEHDTSAIRVNRLDVSDAFTNVSTGFDTMAGWAAAPGSGTAEVTSGGELHLAARDAAGASVTRPYAPPGALVATLRGRVGDYARLDPATGAGASLALSVHTGSKRLAFTVQEDGVYALRAGEPGWGRVLATSGDTDPHTWKAVVDARGRATLYQNSRETGAHWTLPVDSAPPGSRIWSSGSAADPAVAWVDSVGVESGIAASTWDDLTGWTAAPNGGTAAVTGDGRLRLRSADGSAATVRHGTPELCDPTVDFRGRVTDPGVLDRATGAGASMAVRVDTGARRLMLTFQADGVYAIRKGESAWTRVHATTAATSATSWKVVTRSGGEARLYRDGADTGATWTVQDLATAPGVAHWAQGTAADPVESFVEWTRVTCG
ncbi:sialidase family protein [Streptomyces californicus]|uniref:sialidase family protein n=1 Tax=Streptomyces californicus TaxID=67351 RepID=UPI0037B03565